MAHEVDHRPDLRLAAGLTAVLVGSTAAVALWTWSVRDRLPDPMARHWGAGGTADGFSAVSTVTWIGIALPLLVTAPLAIAAVVARQPVMMRRMLAGTSAFTAVFVTTLMAGAARGQLDLADATQAPPPNASIGLGVLLGTVAGVAVALLARHRGATPLATAPPPPDAPRPAEGHHLGDTWTASSTADAGATFLGGFAAVLVSIIALVLTPWLLVLAVLVAVVCIGFTRFRVTVDDDGLTVRMLGFRAVHVPVAEVARADVTDVDAFWEFGGWGLRVDVHGRTGVVSRAGEALRVRRGDSSEVIVTIDDAATAAALLNAAADAHHRSGDASAP